MLSNMAMNFKSKIQCAGSTRQNNLFALWGKYEDIIVVERGCDTFHETDFLTMTGNILKILTESVYPSGYITFFTFCYTSISRTASHTLRTYMYLFPFSIFRQKLHMQTLVIVLLGRIYIIHQAAWFLLKHIGKQRIDSQADTLFRFKLRLLVNQTYEVMAFQVIEITSITLHLAAGTERRTIYSFCMNLNAIL